MVTEVSVDNTALNSSSFYYSLNMLKLLKGMGLSTEEEVQKTADSLAEHYGVTDIYYR